MKPSSSHTPGNEAPRTEERLDIERSLDRCTALEIVETMNREDASVHVAVAREKDSITRVVEMAARAFAKGGRLVYTGAGTSGRLGVLDASECVPTFGVDKEQVIALNAGGPPALISSIENTEDDEAQAVEDMAAIRPLINSNDLVVGITASGTTPYVLAGLEHARRCGAKTVLFCCNPQSTGHGHPTIALDTGPEVLAGSTRLKAGTATKMVLNMITTGAMALSGKVYQGMMIGMKPTNDKLWRRAVRIVETLSPRTTGAEALLNEAGGSIDVAVVMARKSMGAPQAAALLKEKGGSLREALKATVSENNRNRS